jgi:hypothetical protein
MKKTNFILPTLFFLIGSQVINPQSKTGDLPVIDISKSHPEKRIILQDIADIEYIPLETTDDVLLSGYAELSYVSDKYIFVYEFRPGPCGIYVFDRAGKIVSHFNHKGQSSQEYAWIGNGGAVFDEKNEEIFVCAHSIQVYSLSGEYKRTLKINTIQNELKVLNFDDETLLVYYDIIVDPHVKKDNAKKNPYRLISKKDGSEVSVLDIHLPERYSTRLVQQENDKWGYVYIYYTYSMHYGRDFAIADISSDTMYLFTQNRELTPILTRKPSVHTSDDPRTIWFTFLTTDKFILIGTIPLIFNSGGKVPIFMYEFETGEISKVSFSDGEKVMGRWSPSTSPATAKKNMTADLISAPSIVEAYKMKRLKGNYEKIAATVNEDDNQIVRIIKFK